MDPDDVFENDPPDPRRAANVLPFGPVTIFACLLAAAGGLFLGDLTARFYQLPEIPTPGWLPAAGMALGGVGGLAAGVLWCWLTYRRTSRCASRPRRIVTFGLLVGAAAGALVGLALNGGLILLSGMWGPGPILIGLALGGAGGGLLGLVCGWTWRKAVAGPAPKDTSGP